MVGVCLLGSVSYEGRNSATAENTILTDDRVAREGLKSEWGQWLSRDWDWDWWVTLTYDAKKFRSGSPDHTAVGWARSEADFDHWLTDVVHEAVKDDALSPPYWFRGREPNPYRYGTHFHALIGGVQHVSRRAAWQRWFTDHGHARIEPYDPKRGAGFYVAKYVTKELGDLRFSANAGLYQKGWNSESRERARYDYPSQWRDASRGTDPVWSVPQHQDSGGPTA